MNYNYKYFHYICLINNVIVNMENKILEYIIPYSDIISSKIITITELLYYKYNNLKIKNAHKNKKYIYN